MLTATDALTALVEDGIIPISASHLPWLLGTANIETAPSEALPTVLNVHANGVFAGAYYTTPGLFKPGPLGRMMIAASWPNETWKALERGR